MQKELPEPIFLSAPKAATLCGVSRNTVCCWIREGTLPSYRTAGGKNLIRPTDLVAFMRHNTMFIPQSLAEMATRDDLAQAASTGEKSTSQEPSILVVDDDPHARAVAVRCLEDLGLPVLEAQTGFEALHILVQNAQVALVVLDLIMPGQHGGKTFQEVRKQHPGMPVVVVTGFPSEQSDPVFGDEMPDQIVAKPYDPAELVRAAQDLLAESSV